MAPLFDWVNEEGDMSNTLSSGSRIASEMASNGSDNSPKPPIRTISGKRYLEIDQSANRRAGSKISLIWQHGVEMRCIDSPNLDKHWLCSLCASKTTLMKITKGSNSNTTAAIRHLKMVHKVSCKEGLQEEEEEEEEEAIESSIVSSPVSSLAEMLLSAPANSTKMFGALVTRINADNFRWFLLKWLITMHIALVMIESESFRQFIHEIAPALDQFMVSSSNTIRSWIMKLMKAQTVAIKRKLARARSRIHISFDLWTSPNHRSFVGIVAHWLDEDLKKQDVLISLRRLKGSHSGENIAEVIIPVLELFELGPRLGYFIADNDTSNDVAIRFILRKLRPDIKEPDSRRVRCLGHIINLVAKAFLFGNDAESLEVDNMTKKDIQQLTAVRKEWLESGPYGKFRNTVQFIRDTPQRRDEWAKIAGSGILEKFEQLIPIADNQTRWNSVYLSIVRGIDLYYKFQQFSEAYKQELGANFLQQEDWDVLRWLAQSLEPFYYQTQRLQGNAKLGHHGAIWEALPTMEYILSHLEKLKTETPTSKPRLWECVNNSWKKMMKYYELTDESHQVYAAATFLNPTERFDFFDANWGKELKPWIPLMERHCKDLWAREYSHLAKKEDDVAPIDAFEAWRNRMRNQEGSGDEFSRYCPRGAGIATIGSMTMNPIAWWDVLGQQFPSIRQWAFDSLSCPVTSCECERAFSSAKRLITSDRNALGDDLIEALECLKAWWDNGLVQRH